MPATRGLVGGLAVTQTVGWGVVYYPFAVLLVPMQRDLGWSRSLLVGGFTTAIVVSGLAAPTVGRWLDRSSPRALMTGGSVAGTALVAAWSQVGSPVAYYAVWAGLGLVMATTLYEPAFTVLAKRCAPRHREAITVVTLVAGMASFVFQPLTSALAVELGWRSALLVLAVLLAAVTVPVHLAVLGGGAPAGERPAHRRPPEADRRFWALTRAFAAVTVTSFATSVLLVAYLVDRGWTLGRAAFAGGVLGAMQVPGRIAFGPMARRLRRDLLAGALLALPAVGVLLLLAAGGSALVWPAIVVLGVGQGATTLLRVTLFVDLFGTERIGALNGMAATRTTVARALAPLAASLVVAHAGGYAVAYPLLASCSVAAAVVGARVLRAPGPAPAGVAAP